MNATTSLGVQGITEDDIATYLAQTPGFFGTNTFINPAYVKGVLDEHCSGRSNRRLLIWSFLSLEWWLANYFPR